MKEKFQNKGVKILALSPKYHKIIDNNAPNIVFSYHQDEKDKIKIVEEFEDNFNGKIKIYEDRIRGWFLNFGKDLTKEKHSGFIILMICVAYLEGNQQFREGKESQNNSGEMIKKAISRMIKIPKENERLFNLFVEEVRCGLFHDGMTRKHIFIKNSLILLIRHNQQRQD